MAITFVRRTGFEITYDGPNAFPITQNPSWWSSLFLSASAAVDDATRQNSGQYCAQINEQENQGINPVWADTADRFWSTVFAPKYLDPGDTRTGQGAILNTTPAPVSDAGTWFRINVRFDNANKFIEWIRLSYADNASASDGTGGTTIATYTLTAAERADLLWIVLLFDKDSSPKNCKVFLYSIDDNAGGAPSPWNPVIDAGHVNVDTVKMNHSFGLWINSDGKGVLSGRWTLDDLQIGHSATEADCLYDHTKYDLVGYQPDADVTGFNEWTGDKTKKYRNVDDFNDGAAPGTDDIMKATGAGKKQLFRLVDVPDASPTIEQVAVFTVLQTTSNVDTLAGCSDEGTGPVVYADADHKIGTRYFKWLPTTPNDAAAWTKTKLNNLFMGVETKDGVEQKVRALGVEVFGQGLTLPAANAESDNADVDNPWPAAPPEAGQRTTRLTELPPRGYPAAIARRTFLQNLVNSTLLGQDTIYGDPGQVPVYEWSLPKLPRIASRKALTTIVDLVRWTLLSQDTIYGDPGEVPVYEWLVPRGPQLPVNAPPPAELLNILLAPPAVDLPPGVLSFPAILVPLPRPLVPELPTNLQTVLLTPIVGLPAGTVFYTDTLPRGWYIRVVIQPQILPPSVLIPLKRRRFFDVRLRGFRRVPRHF